MAYQVPRLPTYEQFGAATRYTDGTRPGGLGPIDLGLQLWPAPGGVGSPARTGVLRQIAIACSGYLQGVAAGPARGFGGHRAESRIRAQVVDLQKKATLNYKFEVFQANKLNGLVGPAPAVKPLDVGYAHEAPAVYNPPTSRQPMLRGANVQFEKYREQTTASEVKNWMKDNPEDPLVKNKVFATLSFDQYARIDKKIRDNADEYTPILKQYSKQFRIDSLMLIPLPDPGDGGRAKFYVDGFTPFDTSGSEKQLKLFNMLDPNQPLQALGIFIYAMDKYGNIYAQPPGEKGLHHSSFLRGKEVICAGQIVCLQGKLTMIDNASGHYKPTAANIREMVRVLAQQGFDLASGEIEVDILERNPLKGQAIGNNFQALVAAGAFNTWGNRFPAGSVNRFFVAAGRKDVKVDPNKLHDGVFEMSGFRRIYGSANPNCAEKATYNAATFAANENAAPLLLEFADLM